MNTRNKLTMLTLMMIFSVCASSHQLPPPPQNPTEVDENARSIDSGMILDEMQLKKVLSEAKTGDGSAAFRLSLHFLSLQNARQSEYWLLYAAVRGYPIAQYNLWFNSKDNKDCKSRLEALAWISSAALSGDKLAKSHLKEFTQNTQECFQ